MIDHISISVRDLEAAARFYEAVLGAIGYARLRDRPATVGFGKRYPEFWLNYRPSMPPIASDTGTHIACARPMSTPCGDSTPPRSPRAARATASRGRGRNTARAITPRSSATRKAIASRR